MRMCVLMTSLIAGSAAGTAIVSMVVGTEIVSMDEGIEIVSMVVLPPVAVPLEPPVLPPVEMILTDELLELVVPPAPLETAAA